MEAVDDGLRVVGGGEHASVGLGFDRDAALGEPLNRVLWLPAMEGTAQFTGTTWVVGGELGGVEAVVGDVAASAAGDFYFG